MIRHCEHTHELCGYTDCYCNHYHRIKGQKTCKTKYMGGENHIHYYKGETSKENDHRHYFCYYTGPSIPSSCGCGHYHQFAGVTSCDDGHTHYYKGKTSVSKD